VSSGGPPPEIATLDCSPFNHLEEIYSRLLLVIYPRRSNLLEISRGRGGDECAEDEQMGMLVA
jgi:hypothetical protein